MLGTALSLFVVPITQPVADSPEVKRVEYDILKDATYQGGDTEDNLTIFYHS